MVTNAEIRKYIKKIRTLFPVYSKKEKKYLLDLSESVDDFVQKTHQCTMENVIEHFGSPMDVVYNKDTTITNTETVISSAPSHHSAARFGQTISNRSAF